jgi:PAS domain S-box-containing protein
MPRTITEGKKRADAPQMRVTYIYALLAFVTLSVFGVLQIFVEKDPTLGYLEIASGIAALLIAGGLKLTRNIVLASHLILLTILIMIAVMLLTGGTAGTGLLWAFIFPVAAFFLTNKKMGTWWMIALFVLIILITIGSHFGLITTPYSFVTFRQLLASVIVVTIGIYVYQQSREAMARQTRASTVASKEDRIKADIIIDNIGEGVIAVDAKGNIALTNQVAADMLGWKIEELQGKSFAEVIPMVDAAGNEVSITERPLARTLEAGEALQIDATYLRKDSTSFAAEITSKPIVIDGKVHGAIATMRDTTTENAVDRAKTEFVTLASHQLRTPISAISWVSELLLHGDAGKLNAEQSDYVQQVYKSNKRMAALVDAMLTASSLELGDLTVHTEQVDLAKISREVLEKQFEALPEDKILHIKEQYDPELTNVIFDITVVKTILHNLVANAFKYTPSDGTVTIAIEAKDAIVIRVSDTGVGIPIREQPKIFTRLFRAENVKHQDTDGTGLGLYIVKMMAEYVGGSVTFTSEEHKGSTFIVTLPLKNKPAKEEEPA